MSGDGTVEYNEQPLSLTQEAYIQYDGSSRPWYTAEAADNDGNRYQVRWEILPGLAKQDDDYVGDDERPDDESMMCDWTVYTVEEA